MGTSSEGWFVQAETIYDLREKMLTVQNKEFGVNNLVPTRPANRDGGLWVTSVFSVGAKIIRKQNVNSDAPTWVVVITFTNRSFNFKIFIGLI